jgi:hypothetical protein
MQKTRFSIWMITAVSVILAASTLSLAQGKVSLVSAATLNSGNQAVLSALGGASGHCIMATEQLKSLQIKYYRAVNLRMLTIRNEPIGYDGGLPALNGCTLPHPEP